MPFGCAFEGEATRFNLWAPGARDVALHLRFGSGVQDTPMQPVGQGWHTVISTEAPPGTRYGFRIDGDLLVPDPASRYNPDDVHGLSEVTDPLAFEWRDEAWRGRAWHEAVIYELHVGTFTPEGNLAGVQNRLDHLQSLGVTAIELMPIADFPGYRNWGYDGVLPFAPDAAYGRPEDLKRLVEAAHARGLMVLLDVVYNHFGPDGNYLHVYAPQFFTQRHRTPWGAAINFDGTHSRAVRDFFIHNALYWIQEFRVDGLRLDAVHAIADDSAPDILQEIAAAVRNGPGRDRHVHLVLENDHNAARYLGRAAGGYDAQWNDDIHHAWHVLLTGETDGYYADYARDPAAHLGRCLTEGFAYQGDVSQYRGGQRRGEPSRELPAQSFVAFLQNHDQIGNRAFGERLTELAAPERLRAALAVLLLAPQPPLLFMGEEWGSRRRFPFFCDFVAPLADAVRNGRRSEFARFERLATPEARERIPDPCAVESFDMARLDWEEPAVPAHAEWLAMTRELLRLRHEVVVPRLYGMPAGAAEWSRRADAERVLSVRWRLGDGATLHLLANLDDAVATVTIPDHEPFYACPRAPTAGRLDGWSVVWYLDEPDV